MSRLVVKKHRPLEIFLAAIVFSAIFSISVWLLLDETHWNFIKDRLSQSKESHLLWDVNQDLESDNKKLREKVVMLERSHQIDTQVAARLQTDIQNLQDQIYSLKGELEFYQGIMSSTTDSQGLNVQGIHIEPTDQEQLYHFKLVLTNVAKSATVVEVTMDMSIEGMTDAGSKVLTLDEVIAGKELKRDITFKNFERIEGSLNFPKGFKPLRVVVDIRQKHSKSSAIQKIFEWPASAG